MKIKSDRDSLLPSLTKALRAVGKGGSYGYRGLSGLLLEATETGVWVTGQDGDLLVRSWASVDVVEDGMVLVPGRLLVELVKSSPAGDLTIEEESGEVVIAAGRGQSRLSLLDQDELPAARPVTGPEAIVSAPALLDGIRRVTASACTDPNRVALTGVLCQARTDGIRLVATDSFRLAVTDLPSAAAFLGNDEKALIPARALSELGRLLPTVEGVGVRVDKTAAVFAAGDSRLQTTLIEHDYPAYEQLLATMQSPTGVLSVDVGVLSNAVGRVALVAGDINQPVRCALRTDHLTLSADTADVGAASEEVEVSYAGPDMAVGLNPGYLIDGLEAIGTGTVEMGVTEPTKPIVLRPAHEPERFTYALMPIRL